MLDESGGVKITLRVIWHNTPHRLPQRLYLWYSHDSAHVKVSLLIAVS
jgi:hypothetical protein